MPDVILPWPQDGRNDKETIQNLTDTIIKLRKELEFLLGALDEDNVIRAKSVVADWIYAGNIQADQIDVTNGKIQSAQIEDLVVGGNVTMGPNATISWSQVTNQPYIPVLPSYIQSTYIDSTNVISPNITGGTITGGSITSDTNIDVWLDVKARNYIWVGPSQEGFIGVYSGRMELQATSEVSLFSGKIRANSGGIGFFGSLASQQTASSISKTLS